MPFIREGCYKIDDDNTPENSWFNDFVDATKDLEENEIQEGSTIICAKKLKEILKKEKITKADLRGAGFKLLKSRFSNSIKLEYNMEQIYQAMKTIPTSYFFYIDLEYLMDWNKEKKHALSLSKYYAAKYEQDGIKEIILNLWTYGIEDYDRDAALGIHYWSDSRKWFYKGSIGITSNMRFKENYIIRMAILSRKLNLEKPRFFANDIQYKLPYTTNGTPKGVVYHNKNGQKMLTRYDESIESGQQKMMRSKMMRRKIEKTLKERRQRRRLESFVGGRRKEYDTRLLVRPE
ncbi:hypothetical protein Tco_0752618 [Tanacetum coccineum]|uniref:Uncharacterized protein n=1 Tax=Tanacetum coccineum TaxID=301880 RepID=A0ABQ4ZA75_9ASTR